MSSGMQQEREKAQKLDLSLTGEPAERVKASGRLPVSEGHSV